MRRASSRFPGSAGIVPLVAIALACTALACVRLMDTPTLICKANTDCAAGQKCRNGACVPADQCFDISECAPSEACIGTRCVPAQCTSANSAACGDYACGANRACLTYCAANIDCRSGLVCVSSSCQTPRANGSTCAANAECVSRLCCSRVSPAICAETCLLDAGIVDTGIIDAGTTDAGDASTAGALGSTCNLDSDCQSRHCCAAANAAARLCRTACPAITGDYCTGSCSESGAYCDGPTNFSTNGFCSRSCAGGCGYNSTGRANVCIMLTAGSSPSSACKPGCETTVDCRAIHPNLTCWIGFSGKKACDYSTDTWGPTE